MSNKKIKIAIIGAGISGLMCAYNLSEDTSIDITIFELGKSLADRNCPLLANKIEKCAHCLHCSIMEGAGGAGAFSDGKYNITSEFGGWLQDIISQETLISYEALADNILMRFGATKETFSPNNQLKKDCILHGLYMQQSICKHLGTDKNYDTMSRFIDFLDNKDNIHLLYNRKVLNCSNLRDHLIILGYELLSKKAFTEPFDKVIFAVGRSGSSFFSDWCKKNNVNLSNRLVDIGVRVELPSEIWEDFEKKIYEPKILYKTKQYGDTVRMFCFNGRGEVVIENTDSIITVNGHAYANENKKTKNTNFALLNSTVFTQPFNQPIEYAKYIAGLANMVSGGSVIVLTLGDLRKGRRTDYNRLNKCTTKPSLKSAVPGDLSLCMPKRLLDNIIEMLDKLNEIAPGTSNDDTLLYGIECKYYSAKPDVNSDFELQRSDGTTYNNVYAIGDGAGFTRSLAQAAAHGLLLADILTNERG